MSIQRFEIEASAEAQAQDRFPRLGFEVPKGAESIGVVMTVHSPPPGTVMNIGLEGAHGWRGWSGGARAEFTVSKHAATPGYVSGDLEPGMWHVVLGLHNFPAGPVQVSVEVSIPSKVPLIVPPDVEPLTGVVRGSTRNLPAPPGLTWYAGDFHSHTMHSDGFLFTAELARLGVASGLDFMSVTDHNTVSHHAELPGIGSQQGITLIPGQEVTTHRGHANAFGFIDWVDFRKDPSTWVEQVKDQGGILSINHAISGDCSWQFDLPVKPGAVELFHSTWYLELISTAPLAWFRNWDRDVTLLGGSDFHKLEEQPRPGTPTTWVAARENSVEAIMEGILAGRTAITASVTQDENGAITPNLFDCPALVRIDNELIAVNADGHLIVDASDNRRLVTGTEFRLEAPKSAGPFLLLQADRQIVALSA